MDLRVSEKQHSGDRGAIRFPRGLAADKDRDRQPFNGRTLSVMAVVWDADDPGDLGRRTITATAPTAVERPVWMPDLLRAVGGYRAGDTIEITTPAGPETFHIQGFFEDSFLPLEQEKNMQALRFLLDHDDQFHLKDEYISFVKRTD